MTYISDEEAHRRLIEALAERGSAVRLARKAGVNPCHVALMKSKRRRITGRVARELGLKPVSAFIVVTPKIST